MFSMRRVPSTSRCIDALRPLGERGGQATVEAAFLLPSFLLLLLLTLQPVCLLYTRAVMESTAGQLARVASTSEGDEDACRAFALRRLAAVPDLDIFHAGGPLAWEVEVSPAGSAAGTVSVGITGYVRPLPVLGAFAPLAGTVNARGDVRIRVEVSYEGKPPWLEGSYGSWTGMWD